MTLPKTNIISDSIIPMTINNQITLEHVVLMLRQEHDKDTADGLLRKFCLHSTSDEISKKGMEFLYMRGYYDDLQLLINKNKEAGNPSNRKWAAVYQLTIDQMNRWYPLHEILEHAENLKTEEPELKLLIEFLKVSIYFDLNEYGRIGNFLDKQQHLVEIIEDRFLLSFFNIRLQQNMFMYYLVRNELIIARKYAFRVLNQAKNPKTKINVNINLGLSYMYETYYQGMYHLSESLKIAKKHNMHHDITIIEQNNIPFLASHFKKVEGITSTDKSEQAHIEIAKGNYAKAEEILSEIPMNSPFRMYYLGMAKQDKNILLKSYNSFIEERSDYFFSRLPLNALKNS